MFRQYFKAVLKTVDDQFLEDGFASISMEERAVDFKNEFVPLMRMGDTIKIIQIDRGIETRCFEGKVYLSSQNLLRIVSVKDSLLCEVNSKADVDIAEKARVTPIPESTRRSHFPFKRKEPEYYSVDLYSVSNDIIKFTSMEQFEKNQQLLLQAERPIPIKQAVIEVYKVIMAGAETTGHLCKIISMPPETKTALKRFIEDSNRIPQHIFPETDDTQLPEEIDIERDLNLR